MEISGQTEEWFKQADYDLGTDVRMVSQFLADIEQALYELCTERAIPLESVCFFGSRALGTASDESDVDILLISSVFEGKDIFQRASITKGIHRILVKRFNVPFDFVFSSVSEWAHGNSPLLQGIRQKGGIA
jgi:predicted nucleotidyltransferase